MARDNSLSVLRRIADALGAPTNAFIEGDVTLPSGSSAQLAQETSELLSAFAQIADPCLRRSCIEYVRAASLQGVADGATHE
jgi:hypothetical protein